MSLKAPTLLRTDSLMSTQLANNEVSQAYVASYPLERKDPFSTIAASGEPAWRKQGKALLSPREVQILGLLATGRTYKEIAREVFLSKDTVKYHCKNVYMKLRARGRTEALVAAATIGLLQGWCSPPHPKTASTEVRA